MFEKITDEHNIIFNDVITSRRSVRLFKTDPVDDEIIKEIIRAGIIAPFAAIPAAGKNDFRKFFIINTSSVKMEEIIKIIDDNLDDFLSFTEKKYGDHPYTNIIKQANNAKFRRIIGKAPYLIITAERKGTPPNALESLSYCMHSMWLRAVSLKTGYRLIALMSQLNLENDNSFCNAIGLSSGCFAINACVIGYPDDSFMAQPVNYPDYNQNVVFHS